jgi:hypothetical protein
MQVRNRFVSSGASGASGALRHHKTRLHFLLINESLNRRLGLPAIDFPSLWSEITQPHDEKERERHMEIVTLLTKLLEQSRRNNGLMKQLLNVAIL